MEITIRPQRVSDAEYSWLMRKDKELWKFAVCESPCSPITEENEKAFYKEQIERDDCIRFAILADGVYVGNVFIDRIFNGAGELHTHILNKEYFGKGIGLECNRLILEYAFRVAKLEQVYQFINPENVPAWKNALKLGFDKGRRSTINPDTFLLIIGEERWIKE